MSIKKEMKLDKKLLVGLISDANLYTMYKDLADAGGMVMFGIEDAARLESVVKAQARELILSAKIVSAKNDSLKKKRSGHGNGKRKNGNDLPNAKPASKKKRNDNRNGKRKKMNQKKKREVTIRSGKKKKDAFYYCVPGHYGANQ